MSISAGTVPCPECKGTAVVRRHTPNFERVFNFELPFHFRVSQRVGFKHMGRENRPQTRPKLYLEYPNKPRARLFDGEWYSHGVWLFLLLQ